jgi:hypothetical protein
MANLETELPSQGATANGVETRREASCIGGAHQAAWSAASKDGQKHRFCETNHLNCFVFNQPVAETCTVAAQRWPALL